MAELYSWPEILTAVLDRRDLSVSESTWAMRQVMRGDATPSQLAGFLLALRAKGETVDEIVGFRDAILEAALPLPVPAEVLDIVGTGNMEPKLKALAAKLGLGDQVRFRGFQANPLDWMRAAKCVVVPSFWQEPYGLVAAEAVALGRKVVAFAVGGLPEACGGKATLIAPGDIAALAQALETAEPQPTSRKEPQP